MYKMHFYSLAQVSDASYYFKWRNLLSIRYSILSRTPGYLDIIIYAETVKQLKIDYKTCL